MTPWGGFSRGRVVHFAYVKASLAICFLLGLILIAWECVVVILMTQENTFSIYVSKVLICLLVGSFIWLLKTLIIQVLASSFYIRKYSDRIRDSLFHESLIETLLVWPGNKFERIGIVSWHRMSLKDISAWNMSRMMNAISKGGLISRITSEGDARKAAGMIFCNFAKGASDKYVYLEDLNQFLPGGETLNMLTLLFYGRDRISKETLDYWVVNIFRERRALALSLEDINSAIDKVHLIMNVVVGFITLLISFLIFEASTTPFLIFLILVLKFGFRDAFMGIKFLFIMHPFDVGDRCTINDKEVIVEEMGIFKTVFIGMYNNKTEVRNSDLATMHIGNYRRSPIMSETIDFCFKATTSSEKVTKVKEQIKRYVENESEHWLPNLKITTNVNSNSELKGSLRVSHVINFQDMDETFKRRTLLLQKMIEIFSDLNIEYDPDPMKINAADVPALISERVPTNW